MATAPDGQPFSIGTAPLGSGVSEPVMRVGVIVGPGLAGRPETEAAAPGAETRGAGDAQDTAATESSTHTAASRARLSSSSITPSAWIATS